MPIIPTEIQKIRKAVVAQVKQTDAVIASNEATAELVSGLDNTLSEVQVTLEAGFSMLGAGLQELCFAVDDGFRDISYKLDLQNEKLKAIKEILEKPLDTQAKELRKRAEFAYLNGWVDEAEVDLLESEKKNYQDFIALHILGNIYYHHKKNNQKALEYYQKAAKYATPQSKADACKALLCMAKIYKELGKVEDAYKSTELAINMIPEDTHNLYNHAAYAAMTRHTGESIDYLRKAEIKNKDSTCLIAADNDERFSNVKLEKEVLKREIRDEQRKVVEHLRQKINALLQDFNSARKVAEEVGITDFTLLTNDFAALDNRLAKIGNLCANNGYRDLLKAERIAREVYNEGLKAYDGNIEEWVKVKKTSLNELKVKEDTIEKKAPHILWSGILTYAYCGFLIVIMTPMLPRTENFRPVVTPPDILLSPLGVLLGSLLGIINGNLPVFILGISPIGFYILSAKIIKYIKLSPINEDFKKTNNVITKLSNLKNK